MQTGIRVVVLALALSGAVLSGLLLLNHHGLGGDVAAQICGAGEESGCDVVLSSRFASIGKWSLAAIGLGFYASMILLFGSTWFAGSQPSSRGYVDAVLFVGWVVFTIAVALDLVLLGIQWAVIGSFCRMCLGTYLVNVACLAFLWPARKDKAACDAQWRGEGRVALRSWLLASVLLFGLTLVTDSALRAVADKQVGFLGTPVANASGSTRASSGSGTPARVSELEQELQSARAEALRLQQTLDDPNKLEAYQMDRAAQEFQAIEAQAVSLDGIPFKGPDEAPIKVVEFSDFMCPYCRSLAGALTGYMPQSENRVSVHFKNYPLEQKCNPDLARTIHVGACDLALGAVCAQEQGKFWEYHDAVFAVQRNSADKDIVVGIAGQAGLDEAKLRSCMDSSSAAGLLDADIKEGQRLGVSSTPTLFINGKKLNGVNSFLIAINSEADSLGLR